MARLFALTALACLVPPTRGPCHARIPHRSGDIAATAAAVTSLQGDVSGLDGRLDTAEGSLTTLDSTVSDAVSDISTLDGSVNDLQGIVSAGPIPMPYAPATKTGSGSADSANLTVPGAVTLTNGHRYGVEGKVYARKADGTLLMAKKIEGVEYLRSGGNFSLVAEGDERLLSAAHADIATYFSAENRRPALGFSGANVTLDWQAESAAEFILEADLSMVDLGVATV